MLPTSISVSVSVCLFPVTDPFSTASGPAVAVFDGWMVEQPSLSLESLTGSPCLLPPICGVLGDPNCSLCCPLGDLCQSVSMTGNIKTSERTEQKSGLRDGSASDLQSGGDVTLCVGS